MSTLVRFTPEDRELDLAQLSPSDYELISALHLSIKRGDRTLLCLQSPTDGDAAEMHVRLRGDKYWAVHFAGGAHQAHAIALESDEHRRQKDYWFRAADDAGYPVEMEFNTHGGTILDVAIDGPRKTGVEIQHSYVSMRSVKTRTTKSYKVGWMPVWFLDSDQLPSWFHHVPALNCNRISWGTLPPRRAATALGLTKFSALKCTPGAFGKCPAGHKRACGNWHPNREPWHGLTVDDVAAMAPAEKIVPMRDSQGFVRLVSPESLELFRTLTGIEGEYQPGRSGPRAKTPTHTAECVNPVHDGEQPTQCKCGAPIYPLRQLVRVHREVCEGCRIKLGLPAPYLPPGLGY